MEYLTLLTKQTGGKLLERTVTLTFFFLWFLWKLIGEKTRMCLLKSLLISLSLTK